MAGGMPWFKVHAGWSSHPKVGRLCDVLGSDLADAYVVRLWDYCAERQGDGRFVNPGAAGTVERAVRWGGARGALVEAMVSVGLLDREADGSLVVHDWADEQKAVAEKFERDREKRRGPRGTRAESSKSPRDSLSTLNSPVSMSQVSVVAAAAPSAESEGGARTPHGALAEPARVVPVTEPPKDYRPPRSNPPSTDAEAFAAPPASNVGETLPEGWCRLFRDARGHEYHWRIPEDDAHARKLLAAAAGGGQAEVLRRASNGLRATYGQRIHTPADLVRRWAANATEEPTGKPQAASVTRGSVRAEGMDHSRTGDLDF